MKELALEITFHLDLHRVTRPWRRTLTSGSDVKYRRLIWIYLRLLKECRVAGSRLLGGADHGLLLVGCVLRSVGCCHLRHGCRLLLLLLGYHHALLLPLTRASPYEPTRRRKVVFFRHRGNTFFYRAVTSILSQRAIAQIDGLRAVFTAAKTWSRTSYAAFTDELSSIICRNPNCPQGKPCTRDEILSRLSPSYMAIATLTNGSDVKYVSPRVEFYFSCVIIHFGR